jgi:DNA end-binding protein Ku
LPRKEIDDLHLVRPFYIVPDGIVGHDAYAVIREPSKHVVELAADHSPQALAAAP